MKGCERVFEEESFVAGNNG